MTLSAERAPAAYETKAPLVGVGARAAIRFWPLLVPLVGLVELGAQIYDSHKAPTAQQWSDVRSLVESLRAPGSVVVIAPYWAEPMARWKFGAASMPLRDVARADATRYPKALEVSFLGKRSPELAGWSLEQEKRSGPFTLRVLANPAAPSVTYDFVDHLDATSADVLIESGADAKACTFTSPAAIEGGGLGGPPIYPASRFVCEGQPSHVSVGVTIIDDEQARPRRCIWSHPPAAGELVTRMRGVPLGAEIRGHAGMGWLIERDRTGPPFTIRVLVSGREIGRAVHVDGDFWKPFSIPLGAFARQTADVEFRVSAERGGTHVCFEADSR
ncbi:MAG TPA: hypothetical protein VJT73_07760 [Polyangiaceae bacterium]|nr:hypothetical protein [Polyangiaceae bacterium]